jgi:Mn-containing catalase
VPLGRIDPMPSKSLAEEENADQLLNQLARSLMSVAKMPAAIEQSSQAE